MRTMKDALMDRDEFAETLAEIGRSHMPFGKYGPQQYPPRGIPLYDLPHEYLQWFATKGFPHGRLGELLEIIYHVKKDGADEVFNSLRLKAGGRAKLRPPRKREFRFGRDIHEGD